MLLTPDKTEEMGVRTLITRMCIFQTNLALIHKDLKLKKETTLREDIQQGGRSKSKPKKA